MLSKLMKYDFNAVSRYMLPLYAVLLFSTCGMKLSLELADNSVIRVLRGFFIAAYVISLIVIATGSAIILLIHFYKNLMTDQGYLSFTLPVSPSQHLFSKLLNGAIWVILTVVAIVLSVLLLSAGHLNAEIWNAITQAFGEMHQMLLSAGFTNAGMISFVVIAGLAFLFGTQMTVYFCICTGQIFGNHRVLGAFVIYFVYYVFMQIVSAIELLVTARLTDTTLSALTDNNIGSYMTVFLNANLLFQLCVYVGLFFIARYMISKKLNLE